MRSALSVALTGAAIIAACGVDVDLAGKGCPCPSGLLCDTQTNTCVTALPVDSTVAACAAGECKCTKNEDCRDPKRAYCGPAGTCVECLGVPTDTCTAGGFCNDKNQCVVGCKATADCEPLGQRCNTTTHRCVDCVGDGDCAATAPGSKCSPSGKCTQSCTGENTPCGSGGTCCGGFCVSTSDDVLDCGQCGKACSTTNATPSCAGGQCTFKCANGFDHCGAPGDNTGCETNIRSVTDCGACGKACTPQQVVNANNITCSTAGTCAYGSCQQGHFDADKNTANGCEAACGGGGQPCCPAPQAACNNGDSCKNNGSCPNQ